MKTLKENYKKNVEILKENIKRGMGASQVKSVIDSMEGQFIKSNLYNEMEKDYINEMRAVYINSFTNIKINLCN